MKDLLPRAGVVVRTSKMKISLLRLADGDGKNCTKKRAARAARLSFLIQPIKSLICGAVVVVDVREFKINDATAATTPQILHIWIVDKNKSLARSSRAFFISVHFFLVLGKSAT